MRVGVEILTQVEQKMLRVKVISEQKSEGVVELPDGRLEVRVRAKREEGRANERCLVLLATHLGVTLDRLSIVRGHTQSTKTIILRPPQ